jgi:diphthamide synthase (EF-2-diphthine--ammonia ligase)
MTIIKPDKENAFFKTYSNVAYFSWAPTIVGKLLMLKWNLMSTVQFDAIDAIFQADSQVVFDPTYETGEGETYNVEIPGFDGAYVVAAMEYRKNVELKILIMSEIV